MAVSVRINEDRSRTAAGGLKAPMLITCVHQGYELYGSDRSFVESVQAIRAGFPTAEIEVVLPRAGAIGPLLENIASRISIEPLWILRRRNLKALATFGMATLPLAIFRAWRRIRRSDLVYINTTVVADYILASRLCPRKCIIHVHEIPEGTTRSILRLMLRWSRADIIFNSRATESAFALPARLRTRVIYNGVEGPARPQPCTYRGDRRLRLLMLGRISRIKGQDVLVEAVSKLPDEIRPEVRIVGNAFEDPARERELAKTIEALGLAHVITMMPFVADPNPHYIWADVVAVPSRLPESLGRVAIEAMSHGRPPVVSAIGGLKEVVEDNRSGWLVRPNSVDDLSAALERIARNPDSWRDFPEAARRRYEALFARPPVAAAIETVLKAVLERRVSDTFGGRSRSAGENAS